MLIQDMEYDVKSKLNKIDSQRFRGLKIPEIDWKLNEAQEVFVKIIAQPRLQSEIGFEVNQRTIDDIRSIVIHQKKGGGQQLTPYDDNDSSYSGSLPTDYWFFSNAKVAATKGNCSALLDIREVQHDDKANKSVFDKSSFFWRIANINFNSDGIIVYTDYGDFIPSEICLDYLKQPRLMYNAQDWDADNGYELFGQVVTGRQDCELPVGTHREIVDIAVLIISGDLSLPDYMVKKYKTNMVDRKQ